MEGSRVRQHSRCKKRVSRRQGERHYDLLCFSTHSEKTTAATRHLPQFTLQTKLEMDSWLDSKNLNSPLVSSGLFCHRTVKRDNCLQPSAAPPALAQQPMPHKAALAHSQHWDTPSRTTTVISCQHTAKEHNPVQSWTHSVSPPPQESKPVPFLFWQRGPHILPAADKPPLTPKSTVPFPQTWRHL